MTKCLQVRKLELTLVNWWFRRGLKPVSHKLLSDATQCVKDPHPPSPLKMYCVVAITRQVHLVGDIVAPLAAVTR
ncbi:hypothetical protein Gotur_020886, partial [Gossypium turneri]